MSHRPRIETDKPAETRVRAAAYYRRLRTSDPDSLDRQREMVRQWAEEHNIKIVHEHSDPPDAAAE